MKRLNVTMFIATSVLMLSAAVIFAQQNINDNILNSDGNPLEGVTVIKQRTMPQELTGGTISCKISRKFVISNKMIKQKQKI